MGNKIDLDKIARKRESGFDFMYVFWALFFFFILISH